MSPNCPVSLFALPGTAEVELRSENWEQYFGISSAKREGTRVWMGGTRLGSELISSPVSSLGALGVAVFNMLLEDSYTRGFVWVTAGFAHRCSCTSRSLPRAGWFPTAASRGFTCSGQGSAPQLSSMFFPSFNKKMVEF